MSLLGWTQEDMKLFMDLMTKANLQQLQAGVAQLCEEIRKRSSRKEVSP